MKFLIPIGLVILSLGLSGYFVYVTTDRSLTPLEGTFLQVLILLIGLGGTFWIGRLVPANRIHARSAFRRVTSLYLGLARAAVIIEECRNYDSVNNYRVAFAGLEELVRNQLVTADDALQDWRDVVPDDMTDTRGKPFSPNREQE